jgi:hypothetical protein
MITRIPLARKASRVKVARRWRIPWRFLTTLFGLLTAFCALLRVILELWACAG